MGNSVINIPIRCIAWVFKANAVDDFRILCKMKARCGRFLCGELSQAEIDRMMTRRWLVCSGGKYYQKKWEDMFELEERYSHGKINSDILDNADLFKAMLFVVGFLYLMSPQSKRRKRVPKGFVQVKKTRHNGGASHAICMGFFGMSKGWCSKMRKFCIAMKVAKWKRRWLPVTETGGGEATYDDLDNGRYKVIRGVLNEEITARFVLLADAKNCVPYRYRKEMRSLYP